MISQSTYVLRPAGLQTTHLVDKLVELGAAAAYLEDSARAHEATFAIILVPGPIRPRSRPKSSSRRRHFRVMSCEQDVLDVGLEQLPKWAGNARIKVLLQAYPPEFFRDPNNKLAFLNAIHHMHFRCVTMIQKTEAADRRAKNAEKRAEATRKRASTESEARRQEHLEVQEYWGSNLVTPYARGPVMRTQPQGWYDENLAD